MKITKVDVLRAYPNENSWHPVLIRVHTDEGIYGDGEVALGYGNASKAAFSMVEEMAGKIIGMNPLQHEVIWQKLYREACFWGINGGPIVFGGISAIDIALWDIKGKVIRLPSTSCWAANREVRSEPMPASCKTARALGAGMHVPRRITPGKLCWLWNRASTRSKLIILCTGRTERATRIRSRPAC